ncbi:tuftelin-interacting protein 11-related domain containing protein [Babesia gibsoni]|uniref:Tuftelin-interacting protein 11-related domain containing protein n=1 Tax=Babesia gibsoni TaxID=33632 RepID=A0AAD8LKR7_BABGI|nr:tuftelin-interacting protein 11-related domain containing protein [Babesia gibsoni]
MAYQGEFPFGEPQGRRSKADDEIYGVFAESDSDSSDEGVKVSFKNNRNTYRDHGRNKGNVKPKKTSTVTCFVKGKTLNPSNDTSQDDSHRKSKRELMAAHQDESDDENNSVISENDLIDLILDDDHIEYANERGGYGTSNEDLLIMRASREMKKLNAKLSSKGRNADNVKGMAYNPDIGINSTQMGKMYGNGLKMMQKMGYKGGGLGREGTGVVAPIEVKVRQNLRGLQNESELGHNNRKIVKQIHGESMKSNKAKAPYSSSWRDTSRPMRKTMGDVSDRHFLATDLDDLIIALIEKAAWYERLARDNYSQLQMDERALMELERDIAALEINLKNKEKTLLVCEVASRRVEEACNNFEAEISQYKQAMDESVCCAALERLFNVLKTEIEECRDTYDTLRLDQIAGNCARRCLDMVFMDWQVDSHHRRGANLLSLCLMFFADRLDESDIHYHIKSTVEEPLKNYFEEIWNVNDTDKGLQVYEHWRYALSGFGKEGSNVNTMLKGVVVNKLMAFMRAGYNAHLSHIIVHPWLHVFTQSDIDRLMISFTTMTKDMLSKECMSHMKRCKHVLDSWKPLLDQHTRECISSHLASILVLSLKNVEINPRNQDTSKLELIIPWHEYLSGEILSDVFCRDFMQRWLSMLKNWLSLPSANFEEIIIWYSGWKSLFPKEMLNGTELESFFKDALKEMDRASREVLNMKEDENEKEDQKAGNFSEKSLLKQVEDLGASYGITMLKRHGLQHEGLQVYMFGSASLAFKGDEVMIIQKGIARPVSLEELINFVQ